VVAPVGRNEDTFVHAAISAWLEYKRWVQSPANENIC